MEKIKLGDIMRPEGLQYLMSSDQTTTYLCKTNDWGLVISICPESDLIELLISGESMYAYSRQIKKIINSYSDE
jgi:hypothetical protein